VSPITKPTTADAGITVELRGIGVSPGIATGPVAWLAPPPELPPPGPAGPGDAQAASAALEAVAAALEVRAAQAAGEATAVLQAQSLMARDPVLATKVTAHLEAGLPAAHAVSAAFDEFRELLLGAGEYMAERAADVADIRNRAVALLLGVPMPGIPDPGYPYILVARDLAPADTALLDTTKVLAIVTEAGGPTSHTAVISKSLGLPAVVSCTGIAGVGDGEAVLVDGAEGLVTVHPDERQVAEQLAALAARRRAATQVSGPGRTADGHGVKLLVNLGGARDIPSGVAADAEGVGLLRTEVFFLDRRDEPSIEEQRERYAEVFTAFTGKKVVVRTLDAGADKPLKFVDVPPEPNPALGIRGLLTARRHPELLEHQLRAIARAAAGSGADVWVMAPMVSTPGEAAAFAELAHGHGLPVAGTMIEVPAAALRARDLLAVCDFVSLGTNDLAQYTFAADRMAGELADLLDPWQPALLELVRRVGEAGKAAGKSVSVCGEAASDPLLALVLVGLGVTSLSMAPTSVAEVRLSLSRNSLVACQEAATAALAAADGRAAREAVRAMTA
jgi:phosphotransferase system enzyme I (PtsI)